MGENPPKRFKRCIAPNTAEDETIAQKSPFFVRGNLYINKGKRTPRNIVSSIIPMDKQYKK